MVIYYRVLLPKIKFSNLGKRLGNFFPNSSSINRSKFRVLENDEILLPIFSADKTKLYLLLILNQASSVILDQEFSFENETLIETLFFR